MNIKKIVFISVFSIMYLLFIIPLSVGLWALDQID
jgi:hypothetical protein